MDEDPFPQSIRMISISDLMDRWGMDAFGIIRLIQRNELDRCYDSVNSEYTNPNYFHPERVAALTNGDLEQQKIAMQRFQFEPSIVEAFERKHPDLLDVQSVERPQVHTDEPSEMTPKEMIIECCRETARQLLKDNPKMTIATILKATKKFEDCFAGKEEYKVSDRRLRNWLENLEYNKNAGRPKGT